MAETAFLLPTEENATQKTRCVNDTCPQCINGEKASGKNTSEYVHFDLYRIAQYIKKF